MRGHRPDNRPRPDLSPPSTLSVASRCRRRRPRLRRRRPRLRRRRRRRRCRAGADRLQPAYSRALPACRWRCHTAPRRYRGPRNASVSSRDSPPAFGRVAHGRLQMITGHRASPAPTAAAVYRLPIAGMHRLHAIIRRAAPPDDGLKHCRLPGAPPSADSRAPPPADGLPTAPLPGLCDGHHALPAWLSRRGVNVSEEIMHRR